MESRSFDRTRPVRYHLFSGALGVVLVAWTDQGVCRVSLGDSGDDLATDLLGRYPGATRVAAVETPAFVRAVASAATDGQEAIPSGKIETEIPLDVVGTPFQQEVWRELRRIPFGQTRSYRQVAEAIGRPASTRAVARACASNPVALIVPCHRVVRSDGGLSGYRWGVRRKAALLESELGRSRSA